LDIEYRYLQSVASYFGRGTDALPAQATPDASLKRQIYSTIMRARRRDCG